MRGTTVTAYELGTLVGALLPFVLGVALVVVGLRRRRESRKLVVGANDSVDLGMTPGSGASPSARTRTGKGMLIGGTGLIVLTLLSLGARTGQGLQNDRTVALPASVLGLDRNVEATANAKRLILDSAAGNQAVDTAVYGTPPDAILVTVAEQANRDLTRTLSESARGFEATGSKLDESSDVDSGKLGGKGRCWKATVQSTSAVLCTFVDEGSILTTYDFLATSLQAAAERGRTVREATIK